MFSDDIQRIFGSRIEGEIHPHCREERAGLYHSVDDESTECETLNFLNALVYLYKPQAMIETGAAKGFGSIAILDAMKRNGFGHLYSIEREARSIEKSRVNICKCDESLLDLVDFCNDDSMHWISSNAGIKFDMGFFDSELSVRHKEFNLMKGSGMFNFPFVAMFHDTSRLRPSYYPNNCSREMIAELDSISSRAQGHLEFQFSRGFRVVHLAK